MNVLDHGVQLSGPAVDGDLPGPRSAQLLAGQERRVSNTRAGRREHQGRQPDDLQADRHGRRPPCEGAQGSGATSTHHPGACLRLYSSDTSGVQREELYVDLEPTFGRSLFLKCEGFNFAGSIKLKAATEMVEAAEHDGVLTPRSVLVESSSGNLGVALSMIAANKGYGFLCVTDSRCNLSTRRLMQAFGSQLHVITEPDSVGGFLGARINYVRALCASDDRYLWLNQYANPQNWKAHYRNTAPAIARQFPQLDVLFVGAGTCGTLMGCAH
jgi:hypothetical protein